MDMFNLLLGLNLTLNEAVVLVIASVIIGVLSAIIAK